MILKKAEKEKNMIRVAVLYPRTEGKSFDLEYYKKIHIKMVKEKLTPLGMIRAELDIGITGMGNSPSPIHFC